MRTIDAATRTVTGLPESPQTIVPAMNTMRATSSGSRTQRDQSPRNDLLPGEALRFRGRLRGEGFGHFNLLSSCRGSRNGGDLGWCARAHRTATLSPTMTRPTAALRLAAAMMPASPWPSRREKTIPQPTSAATPTNQRQIQRNGSAQDAERAERERHGEQRGSPGGAAIRGASREPRRAVSCGGAL